MTDRQYLASLEDSGVFNPEKFGDQPDVAVFEGDNLVELRIHIGWMKTLPDLVSTALDTFTSLRKLQIGGQLVEFPQVIFHLQELEVLELSYNAIGEVPTSIAKLSKLRVLKLTDNSIRNISSELFSMTSLEEVFLDNNFIESFPVEEIDLPNLRVLSLSNNLLSSLPVFLLPKLEVCRLDQNRVTDPVTFKESAVRLRELCLENNRIQTIGSMLERCRSLERLRLQNNHISSLHELDLPGLRELDLSGNNLSDFPIISSKVIESINLESNSIGSFLTLPSLPESLTYLDLGSNHLEMILAEELCKGLRQLVLRDNLLFEIDLGAFPMLKTLDLSQNQFGTVPRSITGLSDLTHLVMEDNQVKSIPPYITGCKKLEGIWLGHNRIEYLPSFIADLYHLKSLWLNHNLLRELPDEIGRLNLTHLTFFQNQLTSLPVSLLDIEAITSLNLSDNNFKDLDIIFITSERYKFIQLQNNPLSDEFRDKVEALNRIGSTLTKVYV